MLSMPSNVYFLTFFKATADTRCRMPTVGEYPIVQRDYMRLLNGLHKVEKKTAVERCYSRELAVVD